MGQSSFSSPWKHFWLRSPRWYSSPRPCRYPSFKDISPGLPRCCLTRISFPIMSSSHLIFTLGLPKTERWQCPLSLPRWAAVGSGTWPLLAPRAARRAPGWCLPQGGPRRTLRRWLPSMKPGHLVHTALSEHGMWSWAPCPPTTWSLWNEGEIILVLAGPSTPRLLLATVAASTEAEDVPPFLWLSLSPSPSSRHMLWK